MITVDKIVISTEGASKPVAPYSQAIRAGSFVFVAGQVGIDPKTGRLVTGGVRAQTKQAIENLRAVLAAGGMGLDQVVKTTVFLRKAEDYEAMNEVYRCYFRRNMRTLATKDILSSRELHVWSDLHES